MYNELCSIGCTSNIPYYIGNGFCSDENNNAKCHFDGGDCCGLNVDTTYCMECTCIEKLKKNLLRN